MNQYYLERAIELYDILEKQLPRFANRGRTIENTILIISVATSGGLWLLAAQALPQAVTWCGAALSTLTTGLTLYLHSSGVNKKRDKAITLHFEVSNFLAKIRGTHELSDNEFWSTYKSLEHKIQILEYERT